MNPAGSTITTIGASLAILGGAVGQATAHATQLPGVAETATGVGIAGLLAGLGGLLKQHYEHVEKRELWKVKLIHSRHMTRHAVKRVRANAKKIADLEAELVRLKAALHGHGDA